MFFLSVLVVVQVETAKISIFTRKGPAHKRGYRIYLACDKLFRARLSMAVFASKRYSFKNIFDFTTAGDWDCVAAVERLPALHYSVDFIFLSFGIMGFIVEL